MTINLIQMLKISKFLVFVLLLVGSNCLESKPIWIIGHMANKPSFVEFYHKQKANAIEVDLGFSVNGLPLKFGHGSPCDCTCSFLPSKNHLCNLENVCSGGTPYSGHLASIAKYNFTLLIIDSKVENCNQEGLEKAGANIITALNNDLFGNGFKGQVIISVASFKSKAYIEKAALEANNSPYIEKIYFTIDQENNKYKTVEGFLKNVTKNRVYGTGASACYLENIDNGLKKASQAQKNGMNGITYVWTLDMESSMVEYLKAGVDALMVNNVKNGINAVKYLVKKGYAIRLATIDDKIPSSQ